MADALEFKKTELTNIPIKIIPIIKKAYLTHDILREIFLEAVHDDKTFRTFMLAGKEAFDVAFNHFRYPTEVTIYSYYMSVIVNYPAREPKKIKFKYDCSLLKDLIPIIFSSIVALEISILAKFNYEVFNKYGCENLLRANFKTFEYGTNYCFPKKSVEILMKNESIQNLKSKSYKWKVPFMLPSCSEFSILGDSLILENDSDRHDFSNIKKLIIKGKNFGLKMPPNLPSFIADQFHNLISLDIQLEVSPWDVDEVLVMSSNSFQVIPTKVKGTILINVIRDHFFICTVPNREFIARAKTERGMKVKVTRDQTIVIIEFNIHDGLDFKCVVTYEKEVPQPFPRFFQQNGLL